MGTFINTKCGDCLQLLTEVEDKSVDFICTDLPYGLTRNKNDKKIDLKRLWKEYKRVIKDNGCIALFGQGKFFIELVNSNPKWFRYDLVWDKVLTSGFLNAKRMPLRQHEQIAIFYKKLPTYNPQFTKGEPLHSKGHSYKHKELTNNNYGRFGATDDSRAGTTDKYPTSIIKVSKTHPSKAKHVTEKPYELIEWLVKTYTNVGDTVLDSCMGSGSTAIACYRTDRNFIGFEKDEATYQNALMRIQQGTMLQEDNTRSGN